MPRYFILLLFVLTSGAGKAQMYLAPVYENSILKVIDTAGNVAGDAIDTLEVYDYMDYQRLGQAPDFFVDGVFRVFHSGHYGFRYYTGRSIAPCIFSYNTRCFHNGFAAVCCNNKWGLIDMQGRYVADTIYDYVSDVTADGVFAVRKGEDIACLNTHGEFVVPYYYKTAASLHFPEPEFINGLLRVMVNNDTLTGAARDLSWKVGYINTRGKLVIDTIYSLNGTLGNSEWDYSRAVNSGAICGTTLQQHALQPRPFYYYLNKGFYQFAGGHCVAVKNGRPTAIDTKGNTVIAPDPAILGITNMNGFLLVIKKSTDTSGGRVRHVSRNPGADEPKEYGLYNRNGKLIIPFKEHSISMLGDTLISVVTGYEYTKRDDYFLHEEMLDTNGRLLFKYYCRPFAGANFERGLATSAKSSLREKEWGAVTTSGRFIPYVDGNYVDAATENGWIIVLKGYNTWGYLDGHGNWALPAIYEAAGAFTNGLAWVKKDGKMGLINSRGELKLPYRYDCALTFRPVNE